MNIIEFGWIFPNLPEEPADVGGGALRRLTGGSHKISPMYQKNQFDCSICIVEGRNEGFSIVTPNGTGRQGAGRSPRGTDAARGAGETAGGYVRPIGAWK